MLGWKALSGVDELRVMGGPRSASRWGLLLRMEEEEQDVDGGAVVMGRVVGDVTAWGRQGSSILVVGPPGYGGLSKRPPSSPSW